MTTTTASPWGIAEFFKPKWVPGMRITVSDRDAPVTETLRVSDEALEYWGRLYRDNRLDLRGIRFATFMQDPAAIFEAVIYRDRVAELDGFLPLLPAQLAAAGIAETDCVFLKPQAD